MNWIHKIKKCFESDSVFYTRHAKFEMEHDEFGRIRENEVYEALCRGEVVEEYTEDEPYPSVLILGKTLVDRPLHIVCAYDRKEDLAIIITVYHPDPDLWIDFKRRSKI
jgi:hypothetical protein